MDEQTHKISPVTSAVNQALIGSEHDRRVELLGKVVGDYRLVAIVGVGGAGTVYLGERADRAYSAQVAIKVVANTQLNHEVQRRFAAERQILANLNHPYIGRLLDAGETFFDEPFLVMEYVHGEALDRYCDNQRLSVTERIQLFLKICDAVQYAHRNLIVHRDLKPGNILVSKEGIPKLLDFGIAKLLDDSAMAVLQDGIIAHTRVHDRLLTPEYASPEQIRGQPVTTTSDVYALGVILYELLTGVRPYAVNALSQLELERSICIQDVIKPSQRIALLEKESHSLSQATPTDSSAATSSESAKASLIPTARNTNFKKLANQLQGDLDAIIQRALRKEPEKRYSSVEHLIDDLNRHLNQEPIEARQGNRWYYTQRFVRRHTVGVIAGGTALLSLIAVAIILSIQAIRLKEQRDIATQQRDKATQESQRAETVSNFMLDVFTAADPFQSQDKQVTAKELLDNAAKKIETTLNDQPEVKARLLEAIGTAYANQGKLDDAIVYFEQSLKLAEKRSHETLRLVDLIEKIAQAYFEKEDTASTERMVKKAVLLLENSSLTHTPEYLQTLDGNASLEYDRGHIASAKHFFELGLALSIQLNGTNDPETASLLRHLAIISAWQLKYEAAELSSREAVRIYRAVLPEKHPDRIYAELTLSMILDQEGKLDEAESVINEVIANQESIFHEDNPRLADSYIHLSSIKLHKGQLGSAEKAARKGLRISLNKTNVNNYYISLSYLALANILLRRNNNSEAEHAARIGYAKLLSLVPTNNQYSVRGEYLLAWSLSRLHQTKEAEGLARSNLEHWSHMEAPQWWTARSESLLGAILLEQKRPEDAGPLLRNAYQVLSEKGSGADPIDTEIAHKRFEQYQQCIAENRINNCTVDL